MPRRPTSAAPTTDCGSASASTSADRLLYGLLFLVAALPALVFVPGVRDGQIAFVLYREPKLVALQILGWCFLGFFFWIKRNDLSVSTLAEVVQHPTLLALLLFITYAAFTALWVKVSENLVYELGQYLFLFFLVTSCSVWARQDEKVARIVQYGLVVSLAVATLVGVLQYWVPLPALIPIDPQFGVRNPSLMGYKNPMALSLLGQIFILAWFVFRAGGKYRIPLALLLGLELVYLVSLQSRTSYVALAASSAFLVVLLATRQRSGRKIARLLLQASLFAAVVATALFVHQPARERLKSALHYVGDPAAYLESDRGTYFLNTLNMVRHNPFGIGLGDWQTHYPVYRLYQRDTAFSDAVQVRRAHSDHVQFLGETGWPGSVLWLNFFILTIARTARSYFRTGQTLPLFLTAQVVAFAVAMSTDYVLELPYNKFQFFLVLFLVVSSEARSTRDEPVPRTTGRWTSLAAAWLITGVAVLNVYYYVCHLRKVRISASLSSVYLPLVENLQQPSPATALQTQEVQSLESILELGAHLERLPGHTKTLHKDFLALSQTAFLLGRQTQAQTYARESLDLHPYYPNAMKWMSVLLRPRCPEGAKKWERAYHYVMREATHGFRTSYPDAGLGTVDCGDVEPIGP